MEWKVSICMRKFLLLYSTLLIFLVFRALPGALASTGAPYFIEEPSDTYVQKGKSALLNCLVGGNTKSAITWRRNGIALDLSSDGRTLIRPNGSLYFSEIVHEKTYKPDEGAYQCEAFSSNDMSLDFQILSRTARLIVADISSKVAVVPSTLVVPFGDTSRFYCTVKQSTPKAVIRWRKQGESGFITMGRRFTLTPDGALQIRESTFEDQGQYDCTAENVVTATTFTSANAGSLQITDDNGLPRRPIFSVTPKDGVAIAGSKVVLECIANGVPKPRVTWLRDGLPVVFGSEYSILGESNLLIESVSVDHAGMYTCRALNEVGVEQAKAKLDVNYAPVFIKKPKNVHAYADSNALFECFADGIPKPNITWRRNGDMIENSDYNVIGYGFLLVKMLVLSDMGPYQCFAENSFGKIQATAELAVYEKGQPLPPQHTTTAPDKPTTPDVATTRDTITTPDTPTASDTNTTSAITAHPDISTASRTGASLDTTTQDTTATQDTMTAQYVTTVSDTTTDPGTTPSSDTTKSFSDISSSLNTTAFPDITTTSDAMAIPDTTTAADDKGTPENTVSPYATASPDTTKDPENTARTESTSSKATTTSDGGTTQSQTTANHLDTTLAPDAIAFPDMTTIPDITTASGITLTQKHTTMPDTAMTTEGARTPNASAIPDVTAASETPTSAGASETPHTTTTSGTTTTSDAIIGPDITEIRHTTTDVTTTGDVTEAPDFTTTTYATTASDFIETPEVTTNSDVTTAADSTETPEIKTNSNVTTASDTTTPDATTAPYVKVTPDVTTPTDAITTPDVTTIPDTEATMHQDPETQTNIRKKIVKEGSEKVIKCVATASHKPDVSWYRKGRKLDTTKCTTANDVRCQGIAYEVYEERRKPFALQSTRARTIQVLKIRSALYPRDQGHFECVATNGHAPPAKLIIDLDVRAPPRLMKKRDEILSKNGKDSKVTCALDKGNPLPTFKWEYQNMDCPDFDIDKCQPVESQWMPVPESVIMTPKQTPTDKSVVKVQSDQTAVRYRCQAINKLGRDSYVIKFVRHEPLAFTRQPQNTLKGYMGHNLVINCTTNDKDAVVSLLHKRHPFAAFIERKPKAKKLLKNGQVFTLLKLDLRDAGIYGCEASNRASETIQWPAGTGYLIFSREPLAFLKSAPIILRGYLGQRVDIDCSTNHDGATVSLLRKNHPLAAFTKRELEVNKLSKKGQVFTLQNLDLRDAGIYACKASNQESRVIRWPPGTGYLILIRAELPQHFVLRPTTSVSVPQGQEAKVICESEVVSITELQWKKQTIKGDLSVPDNMVTIVRDWSKNRVSAILKITNAQSQDGGVYKCMLTVFDRTDYKLITILVKEPLVFLTQPKIILHGYMGQNLVINCSANDENATVTLLHRHHSNAAFTERKPEANKLSMKEQVFTLLNLDLRDVGEYSCKANDKANNSIRWPVNTGYLLLSRARLPDYFALKPEKPIVVLKGQDANVTCESDGVSVTKLQWKKKTGSGDVSVPDSMVTNVKDRSTNRVRAILKITNAQMKDDGVYRCVLTVFGKTGYKSTRIVIENN